MENLFNSISEFVLEFVHSGASVPTFACILTLAIGLWLLREVVFDFLVCSINCQKIGTGYKNARAIRKQQSIISRITFSYISEYLSKEYRISYRIYIAFHTLYLTWTVVCTLWLISTRWITYENEVLFRSIIYAVGVVVFFFLLLVPYDMVNHHSRMVERRFPPRHHD